MGSKPWTQMVVQYLNTIQLLDQYSDYHSKSEKIVHKSNSCPVDDQTTLKHLNTGLVCHSYPRCAFEY